MGRILPQFPNIDGPDSDFIFCRVRDNGGANNGTRLNEQTLGDQYQFWAKLFFEANVTPNGLADSEYSGYQYFEALTKASLPARVYRAHVSQASTGNPSAVEKDGNVSGAAYSNFTFTRGNTGEYSITRGSGNWTTREHVFLSPVLGFARVELTSGAINVYTYNTAGNAADSIWNGSLTIMLFD